MKTDIEEFVEFWNSHSIRSNKLAACPAGRPDDLYEMPELFGNLMCVCVIVSHTVIEHYIGGRECVKPFSATVVDYALQHFAQPSPPFLEDEFVENCVDLVNLVFGVHITDDLSTTDRKEIYVFLVDNVAN